MLAINGELKGIVDAINADKLAQRVHWKTYPLTIPGASDYRIGSVLIHSQYLIAGQPQIHHIASQIVSPDHLPRSIVQPGAGASVRQLQDLPGGRVFLAITRTIRGLRGCQPADLSHHSATPTSAPGAAASY
jgi:hypothetical protein